MFRKSDKVLLGRALPNVDCSLRVHPVSNVLLGEHSTFSIRQPMLLGATAAGNECGQ
jgi:hypothetical protein